MSTDLGGYLNSGADMAKCARKIVEYCANVKPGESVVVMSDDFQSPSVYNAIFNAACALDADATLMVFPTPATRIIGEWVKTPSTFVAAAKAADCVIFCGKTHIGKQLYDAVEFDKKNRMLMIQGMSEESLIRTTAVDFEKVADESEKLCATFDRASEVEVTSPSGTKITVPIIGSHSNIARGSFRIETKHAPHSSRIEFLPCGRIGTFVDRPMDGTVVMDGFLGLGLARAGAELEIRGGRVTQVRTKGADQWYVDTLRKLFKLDSWASKVVEVGIGTHPNARMSGSYEDYGVLGSIRLGFGGSSNPADKTIFHSDCFILGGTMKVDGQTLVKDGELIAPGFA